MSGDLIIPVATIRLVSGQLLRVEKRAGEVRLIELIEKRGHAVKRGAKGPWISERQFRMVLDGIALALERREQVAFASLHEAGRA